MTHKRQPAPRIAVTGPDRGGWPAWLFSALAIWRAGGRPVRVTPARSKPGRIDGVVLGGGADVSPALYEVDPEPETKFEQLRRTSSWRQLITGLLVAPFLYLLRRMFSLSVHSGLDQERDTLELEVLQQAADESLPVLGICRGAQLINVFAGGTLHRSLDAYVETPHYWTVLPKKTIRIEEDSTLHAILGARECPVNSLHRQAIYRLGDDVVVSAVDAGGIVQGIERRGEVLWLGVQWHPEYLPQRGEQQHLFSYLVEQARTRMPKAGKASLA